MELKQATKCGTVCRLGGLALTNRMIKLCGFKEGDFIIDMGCGSGTTVAYLKDKFNIKGVEINPEKVREAQQNNLPVFQCSCDRTPFENETQDGLLFECSFSKMEHPADVLKEAKRVLKHNGRTAFSDFYAKNQPYHFKGVLGRCDSLAVWEQLLNDAGFAIVTVEDYSRLVPQMWAQLVNEQGRDKIYENIGVTKEKLKEVECGYCVIIAEKRG